MTVKLLLDTDIGSDIDDAVCLAYLLAQTECDLLGITTVTGEAIRRAMLASALCRVADKRVPIFPGAEEPLLVSQRQAHAPQADALERWKHDSNFSFPRGQAVEFLRQSIREHPGEVVLLTIGPLTNIALLFRSDPSIPALLRGLVMMGGSFSGRPEVGTPEWNIMLDPHAAAIVYRSRVAIHRSVGLDVTQQVIMTADDVRQQFQLPLLRPVLDFAETWFRQRSAITFHDPLAAATLFDDHICTFQEGVVQVDLSGDGPLGTTMWTPEGPEHPHQVAVNVNTERFFKHYFAIVGNSPMP